MKWFGVVMKLQLDLLIYSQYICCHLIPSLYLQQPILSHFCRSEEYFLSYLGKLL